MILAWKRKAFAEVNSVKGWAKPTAHGLPAGTEGPVPCHDGAGPWPPPERFIFSPPSDVMDSLLGPSWTPVFDPSQFSKYQGRNESQCGLDSGQGGALGWLSCLSVILLSATPARQPISPRPRCLTLLLWWSPSHNSLHHLDFPNYFSRNMEPYYFFLPSKYHAIYFLLFTKNLRRFLK